MGIFSKKEKVGIDIESLGFSRLAADEIFVLIQDNPSYAISNYGRAVSFTRDKPCMLKPLKGIQGKLYYSLSKGDSGHKKNKMYLIDQLVASAFLRPQEGKAILFHYDGDYDNSYYYNLAYIDKLEQIQLRTGLIRLDDFRAQRYDMYKSAEELRAGQESIFSGGKKAGAGERIEAV